IGAQACRAAANCLSETSPPGSSFVAGSRQWDRSGPAMAAPLARLESKRAKARRLMAAFHGVRGPTNVRRDSTLRHSQLAAYGKRACGDVKGSVGRRLLNVAQASPYGAVLARL